MAKVRKSRWEPYIEGVTVLEECRWYWFLIRWVDSKGKWRESVDLYFIDMEGEISTLSDDDGMGASIDTFIGYKIWKYPEFAKLFEKFDPSEDGEKKDGRRTGRRSLPDSDHRARTEGKVLFRSGTRIDA